MKKIRPMGHTIGKALSLLVVGVGLAVAPPLALAHHAGAAYDAEHPITLTGTITEFHFVTPHTQIYFDAKDARGKVSSWIGLLGPPQRLYRAGWRADSLKPGDVITITGARSKDGQKYLGVMKVVWPDGKSLGAESE